MGSREMILSTIKENQPAFSALPELAGYPQSFKDNVEKYKTIIRAVGGNVYEAATINEILSVLKKDHDKGGRIITVMDEFSSYAELYSNQDDPHKLDNVEVAIIPAHFAVAENGAIWVTEDLLRERVLPFICQHLVAVVNRKNILATMHEAYITLEGDQYGFGVFIAGPSKTADIEQSLILGAHGPKTMTVFIMG